MSWSGRLVSTIRFVFEISQAGVLSFKDAFVPDYENPRNRQRRILGGEVTAEGTFAQNQEYSVVVTATNDVGSDTQLIRSNHHECICG